MERFGSWKIKGSLAFCEAKSCPKGNPLGRGGRHIHIKLSLKIFYVLDMGFSLIIY